METLSEPEASIRDTIALGIEGSLASWWRTLILLGVGLAIGCTIIGIDLHDLRGAIRAEAELRESGRDIVTVSSVSGPVSAWACESLNELEVVEAAGGWTLLGNSVVNDTILDVLRVEATPRFGMLLGVPNEAATVLVGARLTGQSSIREGGYVDVGGVTVEVSGVIPDRGNRMRPFGRSVVTVAGLDRVDSCWIEFSPEAKAFIPGIIRSRFVEDYEGLQIQPMVTATVASLTPLGDYDRGPTRLLWMVGASLVVSLLGLYLRSRRSVLGLWAMLGLRRSRRWLATGVELLAPVLIGFAISSGVVLVMAARQNLSRAEISRIGYLCLAMSAIVTVGYLVVVALVDRGDRMVLLKDPS